MIFTLNFCSFPLGMKKDKNYNKLVIQNHGKKHYGVICIWPDFLVVSHMKDMISVNYFNSNKDNKEVDVGQKYKNLH